MGQATFLTDPYTVKGHVLVEVARRVKSSVIDSRALKALLISA